MKKSKQSNPRSRRFKESEKRKAVGLVEAGMKRGDAAAAVGASKESVRLWVKELRRAVPAAAPRAPQKHEPKPQSPYAPMDPKEGLGEHEVAAILELKRSHPSMGPAQLR